MFENSILLPRLFVWLVKLSLSFLYRWAQLAINSSASDTTLNGFIEEHLFGVANVSLDERPLRSRCDNTCLAMSISSIRLQCGTFTFDLVLCFFDCPE